MANSVKIKRGSSVPSGSDLAVYELGYRTGTSELYINDDGQYRQVGGASGGGAVDSIANFADNRVLTASDADSIRGEGNLTFDGSTLAITGALTTTSTITASGNITTSAGHLVLPYGEINDAGTDMNLVSTNALTLGTESGTALTFANASLAAVFADDVKLPATKKLYLDGSNNQTYLVESSNDVLDIYAGGTNMLRLEESGTDYVQVFDNTRLTAGTGKDLQIFHDGTDNYIKSITSDQDFIIQVNDGGSYMNAIKVDSSETGRILLPNDNQELRIGASADLALWHNGSNSYIENTATGNLYITNSVNDADVILQSDDGSGGVTPYLTIDGSASLVNFDNATRHPDGVISYFGTGLDFQMQHHTNGNNYIQSYGGAIYIDQNVDDSDISIRNDDGSGGVTTYMRFDGSDERIVVKKSLRSDDSIAISAGTDGDMNMYHNSTDSYLENWNGDLVIRNNANDKDILFQTDNNYGDTTNYLQLDGSELRALFNVHTRFNDNKEVQIGSSADLKLYHNATNSFIANGTGNLYIRNNQDDGQIIFQSDDGSGGYATYFNIKGNDGISRFLRNVRANDSIQFQVGSSNDAHFKHDGSNTYLINNTGDLIISNTANDKDVILKSDDGSGGTTPYLTIDGSANSIVINEDSNDIDFRVESNGKVNAIHVDAGADKVNIDAAFWSNYGHRIGGLSQQGGFTTGTNQYFTTNNIMTFADNTQWDGAMVINTNITRASARMCTITVKGYGYGNQSFIDFDVNFYTYSGVNGDDGVAGYPYAARINDRGNDKKKKFVGINSSGNVAIAIGDYNDSNKYYYGFKVSLDNHLNGSGASAYQSWTVTKSTTDGFGWLHKDEPARQIASISQQDTSYTKLLDPNGSVSMYLGGTADANNYYQAGEHRFRNYAGSAYYARIGSGYIRSEGLGSDSAPAFSFSGDTNTGMLSPGGDNLAFSTAGSRRYLIDGSGNHSIYGNTSFSSPMSVNYGVTINEGGHDSDTRIESDGDANMFRVDAGNNRIGISQGSPSYKLDVNGDLRVVGNGDHMIRFTRSGADVVSIEQDSSQLYFYNRTTSKVMFLMSETGSAKLGYNSNPVLELRNTATSAGSGPSLTFGHSQSGTTSVGRIATYLTDGSQANRAGHFRFYTTRAGTEELAMQLTSGKTLTLYQAGDTGDYMDLTVNDTHTEMHLGSGNYLKVLTDSGYSLIGPQNSSWNHFMTDRPGNYFDKKVTVDTGIIESYDENLDLRRSQSSNDRIVIEADQHSHYVNGTKRLETKADGIFVNGISKASSYFQAESPGTMLRLYASGWSNANTHDILYNSWLSNIGDYTYLKSAGNSTSGHGIAMVGDTVFAVGDTDVETGGITNSATAPFTDTWFTVNGSGNGAFKGSVTANGGKPVMTENGSWFGDLGSNGWTRVFTLDNGGGVMSWALKNGQMSTIIDGSHFAYEAGTNQGGGFYSSSDSSYANATGIVASGGTLYVKQADGTNASLFSTGDIICNSGYISGQGNDLQLRRTTNSDDRIVIEASETKIYGDAVERVRFGSYGIRNGYSGSEGGPVYSFKDDTDTGIWRSGGNTLAFSCGGTRMFSIKSDGDIELRSDGSSQGAYIERVGGIQFTWDRDSYGNNNYHAIVCDSDSLKINSFDDVTINLDSNNNDGSEQFDIRKHDTSMTGGTLLFQVDGSGNARATGDVVAYYSSDKKLKDNLKPISNSLEKLQKLTGYEFDWNDKQDTYEGHDVGVVAQEVEEVLPEVVATRDSGYKAVKYEKMVPLLIEAIKEQQQQINQLKEKLNG